TPSLTPTPTFTLTPEVPMVSVSVQTNCRSGPGTAYDILGILNVGQTAEVVGRSVYNDNWIIKLPSNPAITCWLWGQYATVVGNTAGLPIVTPPPTPTPMPGFSISYLGMNMCGGEYGFRFELKNTGSVTWQSIKIYFTDSDTAETRTRTYDIFRHVSECVITNVLQDLEPNEVGVVSVGLFYYDPTGHNITATFTLCTENGLAGTCETRTITFTP
ncbi:MAG: SH3 domain-containing protein, partial [Anaerolineales bacterium]